MRTKYENFDEVQLGDVVQLKSFGPFMTVTSKVEHTENIDCSYFEIDLTTSVHHNYVTQLPFQAVLKISEDEIEKNIKYKKVY